MLVVFLFNYLSIKYSLKSNFMRKVSQEKTTEMTELDKQLADKLLEQKNCE